jgi:ribosomal protein S12 methylthiotransferase
VLKKMRRGYGEKLVRELVERIRKQDAKIWLRTTMLVGHPGEDEAAFGRLRDFIAEGEIDHLGVFPWSREDGTVSAMQPSRVDDDAANERASELMELQAEIRANKFAALRGQVIEVLVDGISDESEYLLDGRHEGQAPDIDGKVILLDGTAQPGTFVQARVMQTTAHDLIASLDLDREPDDDDSSESGELEPSDD